MQAKKYKIDLKKEEREYLKDIVHKGTHKSEVINRARILLLTHEGKTEHKIVEILGVCRATVENVKRKFYLEGLTSIMDKPKSGRPKKLDGQMQARLIAIACSAPPEGHDRWTMELLANAMVELKIVDSIADNTVWRCLKKVKLNHGYKSNGVLAK